MGVVEFAIAGLVISAVGTTYAAIEAEKAADKQEDQYNEQKKQAIESSLATKEKVSGETQQQTEVLRRQAVETQAMQNVAAAASGSQLDSGASFGIIKEQSDYDFTKALTGASVSADMTTSNIDRGLANTIQGIEFNISQLPSDASLVTGAALNIASAAIKTGQTIEADKFNKSLLEKQYRPKNIILR